MRRDTLLGAESWLPDCLHSVRPRMEQLNISLDRLGDFETLADRLQAEITHKSRWGDELTAAAMKEWAEQTQQSLDVFMDFSAKDAERSCDGAVFCEARVPAALQHLFCQA